MKARSSVYTAVACLFLLPAIAFGGTLNVPAAYPTIQDALDAAEFGDVVVITAGTYLEADLGMVNGVTLRSETSDPATVTIDAEGTGPVIRCSQGDNYAGEISGLTLRGGTALNGGGIMCSSFWELHIDNCVFTENHATNFGGGFYSLYGTHVVSNCTFSNNTANGPRGEGGGVYLSNASPAFDNCVFSGNESRKGGGIMIAGETELTLAECSFTGNTASTEGAGLACLGSTAWLLSCTFDDNEATTRGGALLVDSSVITIESCALSNNTASTSAGGVLLKNSATMTATESTILDNAASVGEDVDVETGSTLELICCTFDLVYFTGAGDVTVDDEDCGSPATASSWGQVRALYR